MPWERLRPQCSDMHSSCENAVVPCIPASERLDFSEMIQMKYFHLLLYLSDTLHWMQRVKGSNHCWSFVGTSRPRRGAHRLIRAVPCAKA